MQRVCRRLQSLIPKFSIIRETYWHRVAQCLAISLILVISFWLVSPLPAVAQSVGEYFQINYDPVSFSKNRIEGSEVFYATIAGRATCTKDLPVPVSEASITSRIVAEHTVNGTEFTLNSSYTIEIKPFPSKQGDTVEINQVVPLKFPAQAESGDYNIIGKLIKAEVKLVVGSLDVTEFLPQGQPMGSLNYTALEPASTPIPTPTPTPVPQERGIPWWVWLVVAVAVATTVANVIWYRRHRTA